MQEKTSKLTTRRHSTLDVFGTTSRPPGGVFPYCSIQCRLGLGANTIHDRVSLLCTDLLLKSLNDIGLETKARDIDWNSLVTQCFGEGKPAESFNPPVVVSDFDFFLGIRTRTTILDA